MASLTKQTHPRILKKKKKKKKPTQNQKSNLPTVPTVTSLQRIQRKSIPNILRQFTDYNLQSKSKTYQKQYTVFIKKKKKKNPLIQSLCTKTAKPNQNPNTRFSVAVTRPSSSSSELAHRHRRLVVARPSSQIADRSRRSQSRPSSQIDLLKSGPPVLSSPPCPSQSPSESPVLSSRYF